ncbi:S-layer homology domain-containing protein [Paenibacillus sp. GCM10023248]|uniref:S-layer homology domain-containing protein n=1 Tax=unclassified Paenibacillus TaxID=185978 RepID=UPI002377DD4C|nr:S-layer homology domain-containing protein [Paenibacillus sp. MAHUQ-63]MDD9270958.1 S-layer homology domain-containing protein [Paenibacillus sp. MAHUQ-63]
MKKLTMIATAAMAFSLFASTALTNPASAAGKTSADFTDLANIDAALKTKIDAMLASDIFEGVSDTTFGITQNMTRAQFAKVATLIYDVPVDLTVKVSSFSDVHADDAANGWAVPYIEAAKKAGLIDGVTDTTFVPGDSVTAGQLDTLLLKGLGKKVNVSGSPWYADAVKQATELGIHPAGKSGDQPANRADLVSSSYTAQQAHDNQTLISITKVQASTDKKQVTVSLNKAVDTAKATLTLKNGTTAVSAKTTWSTDGLTATLAVDAALAAGDYTVTLGGLDASTIRTATGSFTIASDNTGNVTVPDPYTLAAVIDSGLTGSATGTITKAIAEDPTQSKFAKEIKVKVTAANGDVVATPGIVQSVFSSNSAVAKVGLSADHHAYVIGNKAGTADITLMVKVGSGDAKQLHVTVTVTNDAISVKEFKAGETSIKKAMTVSGSTYTADFDAYTAMDLTLTDSFGIEYENTEIRDYNFALGTLFTISHINGNDALGAVGTATVDSNGLVHVEGNVTSFELTAVAPSGQKAVSYVTLTR